MGVDGLCHNSLWAGCGGVNMTAEDEFIEAALDAGFDEDQAQFMWEWLARIGHHHDIEDVDGLDDALGDVE